ncbi:hypothetical protein BDQ17DRAFT_1435546 [Cyathus striatus]|nr:hypothetical protein BDQ17DRAFT_1435546 [Cyathus striatus]
MRRALGIAIAAIIPGLMVVLLLEDGWAAIADCEGGGDEEDGVGDEVVVGDEVLKMMGMEGSLHLHLNELMEQDFKKVQWSKPWKWMIFLYLLPSLNKLGVVVEASHCDMLEDIVT